MGRVLYPFYQAHGVLTGPVRAVSEITAQWIDAAPPAFRDSVLLRRASAAGQVVAGARLTHERPDYAIEEIAVGGGPVPVQHAVADQTPFASLIRFRQVNAVEQPRVLLVAPLSGHFSTILAPTVRTLLRDHEVYITDWKNARDISPDSGRFDLDDYVEHLIRFLHVVGPGAHVVAVCQPCVPALVAAAVLAAEGSPVQPCTLTLMSGPVNTRVNPAKVNLMAQKRSLDWYRTYCTTVVPRGYPGAGRRVYPGFLQVSAFMSMNLGRHMRSQFEMYRNLAAGNAERAEHTRRFYAEYFTVLDMPAEFYLDTIDRVFQQNLLARGEMTYRGEAVAPQAITSTALLTIEAENDDMCPVGQTAAAQGIARGLSSCQRRHYVQPGVGHYGIFSGHRWDTEVYPVVRDFIRSHGG